MGFVRVLYLIQKRLILDVELGFSLGTLLAICIR